MFTMEEEFSYKKLKIDLLVYQDLEFSLKDCERILTLSFSKVFQSFVKACYQYISKHHTDLLTKIENIHFTVEICSESHIQKINSSTRGKDKITDVLSFPVFDNLRGGGEFLPPGDLEIGDILLCFQQAKTQAKDWSGDPKSEFLHLLTHGFMHLIGFDHELSLDEEQIMEQHESNLLKLL